LHGIAWISTSDGLFGSTRLGIVLRSNVIPK
jgi:hypothetical protein